MTIATEINEMKATLKLHGKGLRELSDESGVSIVTIWRWRNGAGAMMETWTRVKEAYGRLVGG